MRQRARFKQFDEEWPRHIQEIRRLLRGKLGLHRDDGHGIAVRHLCQNLEQEIEGFRRHDGIFVAGANAIEYMSIRIRPGASAGRTATQTESLCTAAPG